MNDFDLRDRLQWRRDWAEANGALFTGFAGDMALIKGDTILTQGRYAGWAEREVKATAHLSHANDPVDYLRRYWMAEWNGTPNRAREQLEAEIKREAEAQRQLEQDLRSKFGPPIAYRSKGFDGYHPRTKLQSAALEAAESWPYGDGGERYKTLMLVGPVGVGKSHLAAAAWGGEFDFDSSAQFISATALARMFREKSRKESELMRRYGDGEAIDDETDEGCRCLVIDDLGTDGDHRAAQILGEILDRRTGNDLQTVVTTNCTHGELLDWLGERGYSRLLHRCKWVALDGPDHRRR